MVRPVPPARIAAAVLLSASLFGCQARAAQQEAAAPRVTRIRFFPAPGKAAAMKGGRFSGSLTGPTNDFEEMVKITDEPKEGQWNEVAVPADKPIYRYLKYEANVNTGAAVGEVEFWAGDRKLTGTPFSTVPADGKDAKLAFDGDPKTAFEAKEINFQYVGIDLGAGAQAAAPSVSQASGSYPAALKVTLSTATPGATIRYRLDGQTPRADYGEAYTPGAPISIAKSSILVARAFKGGLADSVPTVTAYRIGAPGAAAKTVKTFHIGNSLTDTVVAWMEPLAAAGGHSLEFHRFTIPGAPTDWLWDHPASGFGDSRYAEAFLTLAPVDHVFTQPFAGHGRSVENEAEYSQRFYDACRKYSPDVQAWLYVQWPSKKLDDSWSKGEGSAKGIPGVKPAATFEDAVANFLLYAEAVRARIETAGAYKGKPVKIVPAGLALAELKKAMDAGKVPGLTDFYKECFSDGLHMSAKGAYLVSLVHYACVFREDPTGKVGPLNSGLTPEQAAVFQRIAWSAAKGYRWSGVAGGK
jgi:hypothetical protein